MSQTDFNLEIYIFPGKLRMVSTLSYVIVLIIAGIPIWYHTTKVYRATLPLEDMLLLEEVPAPPMSISIHSATVLRSKLLKEEIESLLGHSINITIHEQDITLPISNAEDDIEKAAENTTTLTGIGNNSYILRKIYVLTYIFV